MTSNPSKTLTHIYKIHPSSPSIPSIPIPSTTSATANPFPTNYTLPTSSADSSSGFIHASTAAQTPGTLGYLFPTPTSARFFVYLLKVPYEPLENKGLVKWESPDATVCGAREGEGMFPHIYFEDGRLGLRADEVEDVVVLVSAEGEDGWGRALEKVIGSTWLS